MKQKEGRVAFLLAAGAFQVIIIILYATTAAYGPSADATQFYSVATNTFSIPLNNSGTKASDSACSLDDFGCDDSYLDDYYAMFQDIHVMIFIGFGFLMTFLKRYGLSAVSVNLLVAAIAAEFGAIIYAYLEDRNAAGYANFDISVMINAEFTAGTVLISFGAVLGKATPLQLLIMAVLEVIFAQINQYIGIFVMSAADVGGSLFIHTFGAYFGLAISAILHDPRVRESDKEGSSYNSDIFSMIGTIFLWVFWPSFNGALAHGTSRNRAVINTYLSMMSAAIVAFIVSSLVNLKSEDKKTVGRFEMVHIQNSTLAGGVAIGTVADLMLGPWVPLTVGAIAGTISVIGYKKLTPRLNKRIHDTCGVNNLHGMPGILAGLFGVLFAALADFKTYGYSLYVHYPLRAPVKNTQDYFKMVALDDNLMSGDGRDGFSQASYQFGTLILTLVIAIFGGLFTGALMKVPKMMHCDDHAQYYFMDEENFIMSSPLPSACSTPLPQEPHVELSVVARPSISNSNAAFVQEEVYGGSNGRDNTQRTAERLNVPSIYGTPRLQTAPNSLPQQQPQRRAAEPEYYDGLAA